jgi:hypothetical protein
MRAPFLVASATVGFLVIAGCAASNIPDDDPTTGGSGGPPPTGMDPKLGGDKKPMCAGGGAEICDGKDNDCNGVIDDVDVGHDGVCDCLTIATLGNHFTEGQNIFGKWLDSRSNMGAVDLKDQTLTKELLANYKVIVAEDVEAFELQGGGGISGIGRYYTQAEADVLRDWVKAGGGFMAMVIGFMYAPEVDNDNKLLSPFGMSFGTKGILYGGGTTLPVTHWNTHPITDGVTRLGFDNGYAVNGTGPSLASESGFDTLRAQEFGEGHVVIWGDEWITFDSEWKDHPDYQVETFWLNTLKWLTKNGDCQVPKPPK